MRNCIAAAGSRSLKKRVARIMAPIFRAKDTNQVRALFHLAAKMLEKCCPKAAEIWEDAEADALACLDFPASHWKRLRTNNLQERTNQMIKRRTKVVQVFPSQKSLMRLVGSVLAEQDERYRQASATSLRRSSQSSSRSADLLCLPCRRGWQSSGSSPGRQ
ncbi:transposase [Atopobium sp. oral taxon 416]|uniref:transposase n=1 Tax=Atopobium sp. oral taxon 416 TaxID=712157 RepID=UPI001BA86CB4|nr:transposase [Atopobium sp. oral taxon 416]QUC02450.1 transposase [Atopobium sp. oral taxon 416]